jgi:DNA-binding NarL/FixJ family response regulator
MTRFWRERARALVTLAESGPAAAIAGLTSVVELADAMGLRLEASRVRLDLGAALAVTDRPKAVGVLRAAAAEAHTIGAPTEARAARRALRRLGVRVAGADADSLPRTSGAPDALTPSELAVARLAATGASNREIAASLFIAPKTVERHVSRALAKSGVRNRTELAARIRELSGVPSDRRP